MKQAVSMGKLLIEELKVERFSVVGTSYGGFVAYRMAEMWPEKVEKVVITSSGINMRRRDNEALLERAGLGKIEELMLPTTAGQLRTLMDLAVFKRLRMVPDFLLNDIINVSPEFTFLHPFSSRFSFNKPCIHIFHLIPNQIEHPTSNLSAQFHRISSRTDR